MGHIDITHLVPNFILGDKNGWALAKAIEKMLDIFHEKVQEGIDTALNPDKMPEWRLDEVAREDNIFWYDFNAEISVKREMVKSASRIYSTLGTKSGTENAAKDFCGDARIQEWFEYGGEPAHFRIYSNSSEAAENAGEIVRSVDGVKRLSAVLEGIYIDHPPLRTDVYAGLALYNGNRATFMMEGVDAEALRNNWLTDELEAILLDEYGLVLFTEEG